ncbi:YsnF/AvaK domain-containing protein [Psychrobacter sp. I-STPA6b]|uniref:YsnF/AvaK domain-containing protein n=1 Tax=Psychrobacter sp. I-STPA6b TaxID=2585718 RepID=UPI001D0CB73D|nr:DUF2382 domain-containing protein [Psychrobacter sp. I-STPA6b]
MDTQKSNSQEKIAPHTTVNTVSEDSTTSPNNRTTVGRLELLEERAVVNKERLDVGKVIATKHVRKKTVNVPIELVEEVLTVTTTYQDVDSQAMLEGSYDDKEVIRHVEPTLDSIPSVTINGHKVQLGDEPIEIVLSRQVAVVTKETYVVQEIDIEKSVHTHKDTISVELQREELDVQEEGFLNHDR